MRRRSNEQEFKLQSKTERERGMKHWILRGSVLSFNVFIKGRIFIQGTDGLLFNSAEDPREERGDGQPQGDGTSLQSNLGLLEGCL